MLELLQAMALLAALALFFGGLAYLAEAAERRWPLDGSDTPDWEADLDGSSHEGERGG